MMPTDFSKGKTWAVVPEAFEAMARKFAELSLEKDVKANLAAAAANERKKDLYTVRENGVAVVSVAGALTKRLTFWSWLMGATSYAAVLEAFDAALADSQVSAIVLSIDSPGGTVNGVEAAANRILSARSVKPVVAFADGMMASAAYWLGSATRAVVAQQTSDVGSIGALMVHHDFSVMDANAGVKITYLSAGKYKALGNDAEPLSGEAREMFQSQLDHVYSIFVSAVANHRGVSIDQVLSGMADGRLFIGEQAVTAGLVDRIGGLDDAAALAAEMAAAESTKKNKPFQVQLQKKEKDTMEIKSIEELTAAYPDLVRAVQEHAVASVDVDAARNQAAADERARIMGLARVQFGEDTAAAFARVVDTGVTVEQFTAIKGAAPAAPDPGSDAEKKTRDELLAAIHKASPENPGAGAEQPPGGKDFMVLVREHQAVHKCGVEAAMKAVIKANPEAHKAYIAKAN